MISEVKKGLVVLFSVFGLFDTIDNEITSTPSPYILGEDNVYNSIPFHN